MTKILTLLLTSTSIIPIVPVVTTDVTVDVISSKEDKKENEQDKSFKKQINEEKQKAAFQERENWKKLIAQNRRQVNSVTKYLYDDREFYSKDALNEYMLKNNRVGQKVTSSNPNKIIKDTENMILDNSKIYDVDLDNSTQVYRDAFGNIAYTREDALATYVTDNSTKVKYSYTGQDNDWHDSPTEAETQVKYGIKINKSLYYQFNGRYYNAFNKEDNTALLNSFADGYYSKSSQRLDGNANNHEYEIYARQDEFNKSYGKEIQDDFRKNYYKDVADLEQDYAVTIKNTRDRPFYLVDILAKNYNDLKKKFSWDKLPEEYRKKEKTIKFKTSNTIKSSEDIKSYFNYEKQNYDFINRTWGGSNWGQRGFYHKEYTGQDGKSHKLYWVHGEWKAYGHDDINLYLPQNYTVEDKTTTTLKVYLTPEAKRNKDKTKLVYTTKLPNPTYIVDKFSSDIMDAMTEKWYDKYYSTIATNFSTTRLECKDKSSQECNTDYTWKKLTFDDLQNDRFITNGVIYKDKVYNVNNDLGHYYSVIKSWYDFKKVKQELLKHKINQSDGIVRYQLRPDLLVTKEELDNFLPLNGNVNARVMYSFIEGNPHLSSIDGTLLANTTVEAKNKSFLLQNKTLRKKYIAHDVFNNIETSFNSEQAAIDKLRHNELLTSKFINNKEIDYWADQISDPSDKTRWKDYKRSWDSIISDGRYTVYYIYNQTSEQEIYFPSLELALKALGKEVKETKIVESEQLNIYVYDYIDQYGNIAAINFENDNFDQVIDAIINFKN